jgi:hypothetical protein
MAWCSVKKKHRDNFTFTFYLKYSQYIYDPSFFLICPFIKFQHSDPQKSIGMHSTPQNLNYGSVIIFLAMCVLQFRRPVYNYLLLH